MKREAEPLVKVTLNLYAADYERMQSIYAAVGAAKAIRAVVRNHLLRLDAKAAAAVGALPEIDLDLEEFANV